ncbi:hypothetical protein [Bradyrhizobium sp. JR3.5]
MTEQQGCKPDPSFLGEDTMNKLVLAEAAAGTVVNSAHAAPLPEAKADDVGVSQQRLAL